MASLQKQEKTAESMRIIYEDSDVKIAASNPNKIILNFVKCDDIGTVREINVIKKWDQFSNIESQSSAERNVTDKEKLSDCSRKAIGKDTSVFSRSSDRIFGCISGTSSKEAIVHFDVKSTVNVDNENTPKRSRLTSQTIEIEEYLQINASLSTSSGNVHSWPPIPSIEGHSDARHRSSDCEQVRSHEAVQHASDSGKRTSATGQSTSEVGQRISEGGRRTSATGQSTSEVGQRTSEVGKRTSETGKSTSETGKSASETGKSTSEAGKRTSEDLKRTSEAVKRTSEAVKRTSEAVKRASEAGKPTTDAGQRTSDVGKRTSETGKSTSEAGKRTSEAGKRTSEAGKPTTVAGKPTTKAGQPTTEAGKPTTKAGQRAPEVGKRTSEAGKSTSEAGKRTSEAGKPTTEAGKPTTEAGQRASEAGKRATEAGKRTSETGKSTSEAGKPTTVAAKPTTAAGKPTTEAGKPTTEAGKPTTVAGQRASEVGQRASEVGKSTSEAGKLTSEVGQRSSAAGQSTSEVGQRASDIGKRTSEAGKPTTPKQSVETNKSESHTKSDSVQGCDHPNHRSTSKSPMVVPIGSCPSATSQSKLLFRKSKSATELSTPSKAASKTCMTDCNQQEGQKIACECTGANVQEHRTSDAEDSAVASKRVKGRAATRQRAKSKETPKRKRATTRKFRQVRNLSSSGSDLSKAPPKRRRRNLRNRAKVTKMVVKEAKRQIRTRKPKWGVGIINRNSNQLELVSRPGSAEGMPTSISISSTTINRIMARLENENIIQPTKSRSKGLMTLEGTSPVVIQGSKDLLKQGTDNEQAAGAKSSYFAKEQQGRANEAKAGGSKTSGISGAKRSYSSIGQQGTCSEVKASESRTSGTLSAMSSHSSVGKPGMGSKVKASGSKAPEASGTKSSCSLIGQQGPCNEVKVGESKASWTSSGKGHSRDSSRERQGVSSESNAGGSKTSGASSAKGSYSSIDDQGTGHDEAATTTRLSKKSSYESKAISGIQENRPAGHLSKSTSKSSHEYLKPGVATEVSRPNATDLWLATPSRSLTSKADFIHMDSEDDTDVEEEKDFRDKDSGHRQRSTSSLPKTSFVSVADTGSRNDFGSVISSPSSTGSRSLTTEHCHYYDAFNETFYDANAQRQVQLLMDDLSKTGFLVSSQSESEVQETSSKNALTATWNNSMHRAKWDETVDLCLICGNQEFYVHRHVLKPGIAVEVLGINPMALHTIIDWMYTLEIDIKRNNVLDIFLASICLDVKKLQFQCINKMHEIINDVRINEGRYAATIPSSTSVDTKKRIEDISKTRTNSEVSRRRSSQAATHSPAGSVVSYGSPETLVTPRPSHQGSTAKVKSSRSTLEESVDREANTMSTSTYTSSPGTCSGTCPGTCSETRDKTSDSRSTPSWTPKQSSAKIAFQNKDGQEVTNAPLSKHCLVEKNASLSKSAQGSNLKSSSRSSAWSHHDEISPEDEAQRYLGEDLGGAMEADQDDYEVISEASYRIPDKMSGRSSSSRTSSVSVYSYSTYGGSQRSLADHFSPGHSSGTSAGSSHLCKNSSSFTFEDRPVPPVPSCKKITVRTDQTQHARDQTGTTEVVTIKKAQTTRIINFKKIGSTEEGMATESHSQSVVGELLMGAALSHHISVLSPVQINKPARLMQTYTLAMPRNFTSDRVLLFGGLSRPDNTDFDEAANTVHCYDVDSGKYERLGKLPTPLFDAAACYYGGGIYLTGGIAQNSVTAQCPGVATPDVWYLDLLNPVWQRCESMRQPRAGHCLVTLDNRIYAIGGAEDWEGSRVTSSVESYSPDEDAWTSVHPLPVPLWRMGAASFKGTIWLCGGMTEPIQLKTNDIFIYSPERDRWFRLEKRLKKKVAMAVLVDVRGDLVLVGGLSGSREKDSLDGCALDDLDTFDTETRKWQTMANMRDPRFSPSVVTLDDKIVIIGGRNSRFSPPLKSVEIYDMAEKQWVNNVKPLPVPLSNSAAVGLQSTSPD